MGVQRVVTSSEIDCEGAGSLKPRNNGIWHALHHCEKGGNAVHSSGAVYHIVKCSKLGCHTELSMRLRLRHLA